MLFLLCLVALSQAATYRTPFGLQNTPPKQFASGSLIDLDAMHATLSAQEKSKLSPRPLAWQADCVDTTQHTSTSFGGSWIVPAEPTTRVGRKNSFNLVLI